MTTLIIIGGIVAAIILGAWLRRAAQPVLIGYRIGVTVGRLTGGRDQAHGRRNSDTGPQLAVTGS